MIASLRGRIGKTSPGEAVVDVQGVGYNVLMPVNDWDGIVDGTEVHLYISTYVREDRFDLYGFTDALSRTLFEKLISLNGIGPRMGLELCSVPRNVLANAIQAKDAGLLTTIKGIGRKTAEKLLVELSSLAERDPQIFMSADSHPLGAMFDPDAVAALTGLGFTAPDILQVLKNLPDDLKTTEERVTAALRNL